MMQPKGFIGALLDFSFSEFITTRIVKLIYFFGLGVCAIGLLIGVGIAFNEETAAGLVMLILSPILFAIWAVLLRIWLEMVVVLFRIAEHTRDIAHGRAAGPRGFPLDAAVQPALRPDPAST